jgi:hypothetical protein
VKCCNGVCHSLQESAWGFQGAQPTHGTSVGRTYQAAM